MIGSRRELLEAIKKTLEQATHEERRLLREELMLVLRQLPTSVCPLCRRERRTLILDTQSQAFFCIECKISYNDTPPLWVREPNQQLQLTPLDIEFLLQLKISCEEQK